MIFLAVAPIFGMYRLTKDNGQPFTAFGIPVAVCLMLVYGILSSTFPSAPNLPLSLNYGIVIAAAFFAYWLTDTFSPNRLGFFTVIIYFTGLEYLSLLFVPEYSHYLLGNALREFPGIQRWNGGTGLTGVSAWIIAVNIGMYHIFFRDQAILKGILRWRSLILVLILAVIPWLISATLYSDASPIDASDVITSFRSYEGWAAPASAGETFGRTCAWVAVLIILYGLVKQKVKT